MQPPSEQQGLISPAGQPHLGLAQVPLHQQHSQDASEGAGLPAATLSSCHVLSPHCLS